MASAKRGSRANPSPQGAPADRQHPARGDVGPHAEPRPTVEAAVPSGSPQETSAASSDAAERRVTIERTITRSTGRPLSTFAGAIQIRKEIALSLLDDVVAFTRSVLQAATQKPEDAALTGRAYDLSRLILDKTVGAPREPYDEAATASAGVQTDRLIVTEAQKVLKSIESAPLQKYLEAASKGIVRTPTAPPDGYETGPIGPPDGNGQSDPSRSH